MCTLNQNDGEYNCIAVLIKHGRIHINALIYEHDVEINLLKKLYGHKNKFKISSDHKSIKSCSYSGLYFPRVFFYDENCATKEHVESDISFDVELLEVDIGGEDDSDEGNTIMD